MRFKCSPLREVHSLSSAEVGTQTKVDRDSSRGSIDTLDMFAKVIRVAFNSSAAFGTRIETVIDELRVQVLSDACYVARIRKRWGL
jgi:hypothetical protein